MSRKVLVLGAGLSSSTLISRLLESSRELDLEVRVVDRDLALVERKLNGHERGKAMNFDALVSHQRHQAISEVDIVISMLPARFHIDVIRDCIDLKKTVLTPSYVSKELKEMESDIEKSGILVLKEIGLDPGIDHMSAMQIIDSIRDNSGEILRFESFTGGLVAPESDNNPWNYKFTWNPRNVVLAGQGGAARFLQEGRYKYIPYHKLFTRVKPIEIEGYGKFEGYANRDSLSYRDVYGLNGIPTIYRGTLRREGYSKAWNVFVQLGMTDDHYFVDNCENLTWRDFTNSFLLFDKFKPVEHKLREYLDLSDDIMEKLQWLGIFENELVGVSKGTPAQLLQKKLVEKWSLEPQDKDMIVMWHRFNYMMNDTEKQIHSHMVVIGDVGDHTAMSKTVGLPIGIASELVLKGEINSRGLMLPTAPSIYNPVMKELESCGIVFKEDEIL
jgi:saccharopine dehydrogenase-like NADP-dependent oxidoreductase